MSVACPVTKAKKLEKDNMRVISKAVGEEGSTQVLTRTRRNFRPAVLTPRFLIKIAAHHVAKRTAC